MIITRVSLLDITRQRTGWAHGAASPVLLDDMSRLLQSSTDCADAGQLV